ncbi:hypothetical protein JCM33374_g3232 [Metschnikowia sp. JCM 33374]|nr:hypothetical protein JCM33374_g3232 [Metschnikowia sp. JCM 33374]
MRSLIVFLSASCVVTTLAVVDSPLASACVYYMKTFNWGCAGLDTPHNIYKCRCKNIDWIGSVANCISTQGNNKHETEHAWKHLATQCSTKAHVYFSAADSKHYSSNATRYMNPAPWNKTVPVYHPIPVDRFRFQVYRRSFDDIRYQVKKSEWFAWGLVSFWGVILLFLTVKNCLWSFFRLSVIPRTLRQWHQRYMTRETWCFGLSAGDVILVALFIAQTAVSTALSYNIVMPNVLFKHNKFLTLHLLGNRSAIISFWLMPLVYVFGLRNNPFCTLTGLPQSTFIRYHKVVAIVLSIEALIHSWIWTAFSFANGGYFSWSFENYWRWGMVGTCVLFIMLAQSIRAFRSLVYEGFLVLHKFLGWVFIAAMWYHCIYLGWMGWVYSLIAILAYDRAVRVFKIFFVNGGFTRVQMSVVDDKIVKLTVPKAGLHDKIYRPGSHIFISFYHWSIWYRFFQSHPFTITTSPLDNQHSFVIYIRIKKGTTRVLGNLQTDDKGNLAIMSLIEGPYGNGVSTFTKNEQLVGIAGGLGLCALLPTFYQNPNGSLIFWAVNNTADIDYLSRELGYLISKGADVRVHLTSRNQEAGLSIESKYNYVTCYGERPNVDEWVAEGLSLGILQNKTHTYVLACGPGRMDQMVQNSVSERTVVGSTHCLHYKQENYSW